jgi:hypothetical protein
VTEYRFVKDTQRRPVIVVAALLLLAIVLLNIILLVGASRCGKDSLSALCRLAILIES